MVEVNVYGSVLMFGSIAFYAYYTIWMLVTPLIFDSH